MRDATVDSFEEMFQRFYREQFTVTTRLARLLTGNASVAEDLAQEAFIRVYRYAQAGNRPIHDPTALLHITTTNLCRSWHVSEKRDRLRVFRHGVPDQEASSELGRDLEHSLRRLPYDQRAVIVFRYWLGLSEVEIAESLGCRPGTVKSRHSRALHALRKELA